MSPIHEENGKWYFWDEVWVDRYGPYDTEEECKEALDRYCREVLELPSSEESPNSDSK